MAIIVCFKALASAGFFYDVGSINAGQFIFAFHLKEKIWLLACDVRLYR